MPSLGVRSPWLQLSKEHLNYLGFFAVAYEKILGVFKLETYVHILKSFLPILNI